MSFDRFRASLWIRLAFLVLSLLAALYLMLETRYHLSAVFLFFISMAQVMGLYRYLEKTFRQLGSFFDSITYDDFSQSFSSHTHNRELDNLYSSVRATGLQLKELRKEAEEQKQFLQNLVQHLHIGLIAYDEQGELKLMNTAAKRLIENPALKNIDELPESFEALRESLREPDLQKRLLRIRLHDDWTELMVYRSSFRMQNNLMHVAGIQNIGQELSQKEQESWEEMMKVLTHEIMNSITPITSLASTVNEILEGDHLDENLPDLKQAMRTVEKRSMGLLKFVENFRQLTRLPEPDYSTFPLSELFHHLQQVMKDNIEKEQVHFNLSIVPESLNITADREMLEQVMINLLLNSLQALRQAKEKKISLKAFRDDESRLVIQISDNGSGIAPEARDKVFVPFFSTRKEGSGIGLSLSRQIMKQHKGSISFLSEPGIRTTFTLRFP
jgi:two-component system, NtrC family, nitrogen regulation sensor histidine kinase NtrY